MNSYESMNNRLALKEAELAKQLLVTKDTRAEIKALKVTIAKAEPEAVKKNKKDSDGLPLVEVRDEGETEVFVFTDGKTSKIETVKK